MDCPSKQKKRLRWLLWRGGHWWRFVCINFYQTSWSSTFKNYSSLKGGSILVEHCPMTDYYLQLCSQNSHRRRQDQGRKYETMSLISFSSLIIVISSVELPYLSTATNWRLHANDKEMSRDESVSVGQTVFFFIFEMVFLTFTIWKDLTSMISLMEPKYCENLETRFCVMLSIHSPPISLSPATCILVTPSRTLKILSCRVWESKMCDG